MRLSEATADLLADQHGAVARWQLIERADGDDVDQLLRQGLLRRFYRGVWVAAGAPETPELRLMAAILRCGKDARADGRASCWLMGLEGFAPTVGVVVPAGRHVTGAPFAVKATLIEPKDESRVRRIPCLAAPRELIEVAPLVSDKALRVAIDSARRLGLVTVPALESRAAELRGLHGARIILHTIGSRILDQESEGERVLARVFRGFEGLEWGVKDLVPNRRLDCLIRDALLVLEYDGRDHHVLPTDRDADGLRDLEIRSVTVDGIPLEVIRITKGMLHERREAVLAFVMHRREERRAEIAARRNSELHAHRPVTPSSGR